MPSSMDYISSGMVSEDFGIEQKPACMVFLHLNSVGNGGGRRGIFPDWSSVMP